MIRNFIIAVFATLVFGCSNNSTNQPVLDTGSYEQPPMTTDTFTTLPYMTDSLPLKDSSSMR